MKKKYHIVDADGSEYEVEEIMEDEDKSEMVEEKVEETEAHDELLSEDEIAALRRLAAVADKLIALTETSDEDEEIIENEEEDVCDEDEEFVEEKEEEVIDTCEEEETKPRDSKRSIGALEKTQKIMNDSLVDDVAEAWAKRYGGIK